MNQKNIDRLYKASKRAIKAWEINHEAARAWGKAQELATDEEWEFFCKGMEYSTECNFGDFGA